MMLNPGRIAVLSGLAVMACQAQAGKPLEFDVVSVKPTASQGNGMSMRVSNGYLQVTGATLKQLITMCYGLLDFQVSGGPTSSTMDSLARSISGSVGRPVVNKTGLAGKFDWKLEWTPETGQMKPQVPGETQAAAIPESTGPSLFTALQEQLGLKLEAQKGSAPMLVIERAEKPEPN